MSTAAGHSYEANTTTLWMVMAGVLLTMLSLVAASGIGAVDIAWRDVLRAYCGLVGGECGGEPLTHRIVNELRLPRTVLAWLAGAGLALAGAVLQTVTRNPLADPYLFGISSGAAFGAVLVISAIGAGTALGSLGISAGALIGAGLSVALVLTLAGNGVQIERMLLAGVAVSFMFSAGTSLVLYYADPQASATLIFWTLGSFASASWRGLFWPTFTVVACLLVFLAYSRPLRAMLAGDESARALGVSVNRLRVAMLLLSSVMTAVLVATCGGIGFVGLMIPHIVRRLCAGNSHHFLLLTTLAGGIFMVWVDVLARTIMPHSELPVGVITAAVGSVFFMLVLRRRAAHG